MDLLELILIPRPVVDNLEALENMSLIEWFFDDYNLLVRDFLVPTDLLSEARF